MTALQAFGLFWVLSSLRTIYQLFQLKGKPRFVEQENRRRERIAWLLAVMTLVCGIGLLLWKLWVISALWFLVGLQMVFSGAANSIRPFWKTAKRSGSSMSRSQVGQLSGYLW